MPRLTASYLHRPGYGAFVYSADTPTQNNLHSLFFGVLCSTYTAYILKQYRLSNLVNGAAASAPPVRSCGLWVQVQFPSYCTRGPGIDIPPEAHDMRVTRGIAVYKASEIWIYSSEMIQFVQYF